MATDIKDLRVRLDQITEQIISGLKDRSRHPLNILVFTEEFSDGLTWIRYRLKGEQDLDSEFGRYEFDDQYPLSFTKEELAAPKIKRKAPSNHVRQVYIDIGQDIIEFYIGMLPELCKDKQYEDRASYGETTKVDANNLLLYHERINGLGRHVAQSKIDQNPGILELETDEEIRKALVVPEREEEVIGKAIEIARKYDLDRPRFIREFFRGIMDLTIEAEVKYVKQVKKECTGKVES
jgi:chorismate mutase